MCRKQERGELKVRDVIGQTDIIVSNQVSMLDFIFMEMAYAPVFTAVCTRNGKYGLRKIGMLELPWYAMGIKLPREELNDKSFFTDLQELRDSLYVRNRPIVVFPEGTKTNGRGILEIEPEVVRILVKAAEAGLKIHTIRFDYDFVYSSPYNTTDVRGLKTMLKLLTQVRNSLMVQYYFNLEEKLAVPAKVNSTPVDPNA